VGQTDRQTDRQKSGFDLNSAEANRLPGLDVPIIQLLFLVGQFTVLPKSPTTELLRPDPSPGPSSCLAMKKKSYGSSSGSLVTYRVSMGRVDRRRSKRGSEHAWSLSIIF